MAATLDGSPQEGQCRGLVLVSDKVINNGKSVFTQFHGVAKIPSLVVLLVPLLAELRKSFPSIKRGCPKDCDLM
jgi:hypothetical protein